VDDGRNAGYAPSLALAPTAPYTAYATFGRLCAADPSDNGLVFARRTPEGRWISETVDNQGFVNTGWNKSTALALEPAPPYTPHIAYNVYDLYPLIKYARLSGTTWISEVVAQNGTEVSFALEADPPYSPHITFLDTNGHLAHAWLSGTAWMVETAIGEWVDYYALDIASTAPFTPHVAYSPHDRIGLEHAWKAAGGWVTETVAYQYGSLFDLALEPAPPHTPHVSYGLTCFPGPDCGLLHAWWTSSGWLTETVQPGTGDWPVGWTSVIVEASPPYDPRFTYCWKDEKLNYAWWEGSSWEHTTLRRGNSCNSVDQSLEAVSPYPAHMLYHDGGLIHVWQAPPHRLYLPVILRFY
jgi:hypothetical protein